jgi:hypothetical protein
LYHTSPQEIIKQETTNYGQDFLTNQLITGIQKKTKNIDDQGKIAISLVRYLPAVGTKPDMYTFQYPYVSLSGDSGVCIDNAICLSYILSRLGFDSCVMYFSGGPGGTHAATGIRVTQDSIANFRGTGYAIIEITEPAVPTEAVDKDSGSLSIFKVGNGVYKMNLTKEYHDGQRYAYLNANYHNLNNVTYAEFRDLTAYYGIGSVIIA